MEKESPFKKYRFAYYFIAPTAIGMLIMHLIPILQGFYMSLLQLNNFTLSQYLGAPFVGVRNYYDILFSTTSPMRIGIIDSIRNTVIYAVFVTIGQIGVGMIVALMLNMEFKGRSLIRTLFLFSWIVPTYVTGLLWGFMWQSSIGIINIILYDFFKWHLIAAKLNLVIHFFQLDKVVSIFNFFIGLIRGIILSIDSNLNFVIQLLLITAIIYGVVSVKRKIQKKYSEGKSLLYIFIVIAFVFLALFDISFPVDLSVRYKPFWLVGTNTIWAIIIPTIWRFWPLSMLMLLAGLQNVPSALYDAAKIDGANNWMTFWKITWPMLTPVWSILVLFGLIYNVYSFNIVIMMFGNGAGFPGEWGDLMMTNIFRNSFMRWDFGAGAATSVVLLCVMVAIVNYWYKFYKKSEEIY
jgi:ABC-type sugar transport system permease subunit